MYTMAFSAAIAIVAAVAVGLINNVVEIAGKSGDRSDFLTFGKIVDALEGGAKGSITVAVACGVAGIISGCITVTGPGLQAAEHHRQPLRRPHDHRPGADHALLHRAGHGRAHHRQLLHHGGPPAPPS